MKRITPLYHSLKAASILFDIPTEVIRKWAHEFDFFGETLKKDENGKKMFHCLSDSSLAILEFIQTCMIFGMTDKGIHNYYELLKAEKKTHNRMNLRDVMFSVIEQRNHLIINQCIKITKSNLTRDEIINRLNELKTKGGYYD